MHKHEFWSLIKASQREEEQNDWLTDRLVTEDLDTILEFEVHLQRIMNESYQSNLWAAAYVIMGGCSDDTFDYFRGWLIGQGEEVYNRVLQNPEYLAEYISDDRLDEEGYPQNEELLSVGFDAYSLIKTGDLEWDDSLYDEFLSSLDEKRLSSTEDIDLNWEEDDLEELFPLLWERFGEDPLG
ncbi:DUF4240 domain-containing protein [Cytobacillus spongiae]|uniref:DUF4240 domain-containing protein n=1 Tax=Cytobacillus spongiae TaxID=2901381 RepID=UPI001F1C3155|nr:DUF4240 domain-containing protein [Cytobacillus spongiae]UII56446.1 DUF4240 domain-containing protein [Cytobacillus spongiae]